MKVCHAVGRDWKEGVIGVAHFSKSSVWKSSHNIMAASPRMVKEGSRAVFSGIMLFSQIV